MLSEREKAARCALFDSYCHTILRNAIRDYNRHNSYKEKLEILLDDPESFLEVEQFSEDDHPSSHLYISYRGRRYQLDYEPLYLAMNTLQERELGVLILDYCWNGRTHGSLRRLGLRIVRFGIREAVRLRKSGDGFPLPAECRNKSTEQATRKYSSKSIWSFMSLKYETIEAAARGDEGAVNEVLIEYEPFMLFLSIIVRRDANGKQEKAFSEDAFQTLRQKLIEELPNWKEHCK